VKLIGRYEQWRTHLAGSELLGNSTVNELEGHLREEMEHLKTSGLSDEEAFLVAQHRLGDTASQISLVLTQWTDMSPRTLGLVAGAVRVGAFCAMAALVLWLCTRYFQPGVHSHIGVSRHLRLVFLLGLFAYTLGLSITRLAEDRVAVRTIIPSHTMNTHLARERSALRDLRSIRRMTFSQISGGSDSSKTRRTSGIGVRWVVCVMMMCSFCMHESR
jgi:hypothetical protein